MSGRKTLKRSSRSRSRSRNNIRSKLVAGITKGMIVENPAWGNIEGLTEENVNKYGFQEALKRHKRMTAKKMHRYPNWFQMIDKNRPEESIRRLRLELSPQETYASHKNASHHMTKGEKAKFYKEKGQREGEKEKRQFAKWKKYNPEGTFNEFTSLRAIRKFLDKAEAEEKA